MTGIRRWWESLNFFWQVYLFMIAYFGGLITVIEGVVEPAANHLLADFFTRYPVLGEAIMWTVGTMIPTLLIGWIVTRLVVRKLDSLETATRRLAAGELTARMSEAGDDRDVFNRLSRNFNTMAESLEKLVVNEKRLLADISHELRSPLTRMNIATALLPKKRSEAGFDALVRNLESEIGQMSGLVETLLEQGRDRLTAQTAMETVDLSMLTEEMLDGYRTLARENGRSITARVEPGLRVSASPVRLRMILENILNNAMLYAPPGTAIDVRAWQEDATVKIAIRDYGPGIPHEHLGKIFRAFFRVDDSRDRRSGGVGLGLTLARESALLLGGTIEARNVTPGLEMTLILPRPGSGDAGGPRVVPAADSTRVRRARP
ncbi:MAG: HAMP domain-containing histidine kinase [Planctomycetes bacterium]|nr:HAMP domain-containing histidine kinase [Planctomycetota bacterium]